jgi:hypothetical protein
VKDAVDDNHDRISELESRVPEVGAVSVSSYGFHPINNCQFTHLARYVHITAAGNCNVVASLALPHNSIITEAYCLIYDNDATANISVDLMRASLGVDTDHLELFRITGTNNSATASNQSLVNQNTGGNLVDNTTYAYYLKIAFNANAITTPGDLRLYSCEVNYQRGNL